MVTFGHDRGGTSEEAWQAWPGWQRLAPLTLQALTADGPGRARLVLLAAHPDDETLGAGGLLAAAGAAGVRIDVVVATAGEASHPDSSTHRPADLAAIRGREVSTAVAELAPDARLHLLDLPDGRLGTVRDRLSQALRAVVDGGGPGEAILPALAGWLVAPWRGDGHPDHEVAGQVAVELAAELASGVADAASGTRWEVLEYPIWAWHWGTPRDDRLPWSRARTFAVDPAGQARRAAAVAHHRSQVRPLSDQPGDEVLLSDQMLAHFRRPVETFFVPVGRDEPAPSGGPGVQPAPGGATDSLSAGYFDELYAAADDPWGFTHRWYERRKRALTLASLPRERFRRAFEPGCSIGVLTEQLAARCTELVSMDVSAAALRLAADRVAGQDGVRLECGQVPRDWPAGVFDLVVLSEVGYYCGPADLDRLVERSATALTDDGVLVACHWRHPVTDYPVGGDLVHQRLRAHPRLHVLARHEEEDFLLEVLVPGPVVSVARAGGLLR